MGALTATSATFEVYMRAIPVLARSEHKVCSAGHLFMPRRNCGQEGEIGEPSAVAKKIGRMNVCSSLAC